SVHTGWMRRSDAWAPQMRMRCRKKVRNPAHLKRLRRKAVRIRLIRFKDEKGCMESLPAGNTGSYRHHAADYYDVLYVLRRYTS
ncbi:hypothetical protein ACFO6W_22785, partial [Dysgonomonas termitidis]